MAELVIPIRNYIGASEFNWDTFEFEWATNADDVRMAVQYGLPTGEPVTSICLEIGTCYGGSTIAGTEIYNYLQSLGLPIRTRILSLAASMGTVIPLVGSVIEIDATAQMLVHGPSGYADGTVGQVGSSLKQLTDTHNALRDIYVARTGQPVEVVEEWMSKDTWFTAQEAVAAGLATAIIAIAPKAAAQVTDAQASARRARYAGIVARADKRTVKARATPKPRTKPAAAAASTPRPMAKKVITPAAQQQANIAAVQAFAKQLGVKATIEGAEAEVVDPVAEAVPTVLADGAGTLYTDGTLAQGSAVFNDEALTAATADGEYEAEDGRVITVASGVVESIADASAEGDAAPEAATGNEAITALITAALAPLRQEVAEMKATFNKAVPPTPRPRAKGSQQADPKASGKSLLSGASAGN